LAISKWHSHSKFEENVKWMMVQNEN